MCGMVERSSGCVGETRGSGGREPTAWVTDLVREGSGSVLPFPHPHSGVNRSTYSAVLLLDLMRSCMQSAWCIPALGEPHDRLLFIHIRHASGRSPLNIKENAPFSENPAGYLPERWTSFSSYSKADTRLTTNGTAVNLCNNSLMCDSISRGEWLNNSPKLTQKWW